MLLELVEYGNSYKGIKNFGSLLTPKKIFKYSRRWIFLGQVSKSLNYKLKY